MDVVPCLKKMSCDRSFYVVVVVFVTTAIGNVGSAQLPSYFDVCHRSDPNVDKCTLDQLGKMLSHLQNGDKKLGIPKLDPFYIQQLNVNNSGLNIRLNDMIIRGVQNIRPSVVHHDFRKKRIHVELFADSLSMNGKYHIEGKIVFLPINGNGTCKVDVDGTNIVLNLNYRLKMKEGQEYMEFNVERSTVEFTIKKALVNFSDLFSGNKELEKAMNDLLNEEWMKVLEDIKPAVSTTILTVTLSILRNLFEKFPHSALFPK